MESFIERMRLFEKQIELEWKVSYFLGSGDSCQIFSDPTTKTHNISIPERWLKSTTIFFSIYLHEVLHELCHAKLAELIDPIFSTVIFSKKYSIADRKFQKSAKQLYLSQSHVDIWVNDLRHHVWPHVTIVDCASFLRAAEVIFHEDPTIITDSLELSIALAQYLGEAKRRSLFIPLLPQSLLTPLIIELSQFYQSLPPLSYNKTEDIRLLEKTTQQAARILDFQIIPKLVDEEGRIVWIL